MIVTISGIEYGYEPGSFSLDDKIKVRTTCTFTVNHGTSRHFAWHEPVTVKKADGTLIFTGFIETFDEIRVGNSDRLKTSIECIDNHWLADKRRVNKVFTSTDAGTAVEWIVDEILDEEGVTAGTIETGIEIERWPFSKVRCSDAISEMAEASNYIWYIDKNKALHFQSRTSNAAPWQLNWNDIQYGTSTNQGGAPDYRNRQWIRGASDTTSSQTKTEYGDGEKREFLLGYDLAAEPTIEVNLGAGWVSQTVATKAETGAEWYYEIGSNAVTHDDGEVVLGNTDRVRVTYTGSFQFDLYLESSTNQTALATTEGTGTGIVEDVRDGPEFQTIGATVEAASNLLGTYMQESGTLPFATIKEGLEAGQILTINLPHYDEEGTQWLVESVEISEFNDAENTLLHNVTISSGPAGGSWVEFWNELLRSGDKRAAINILDEDIREVISFSKTWAEDEEPEPFEKIFPDEDEEFGDIAPCFEDGEEVLYFAWGDGTPGASALGNELGRKAITKLVVKPEQLFSIVMLYSSEANEAITEVAWFGGYTASAAADSGVLIEARSWSRTKTSDEIWQVQRTDTKGY